MLGYQNATHEGGMTKSVENCSLWRNNASVTFIIINFMSPYEMTGIVQTTICNAFS